MKNIENRTKIYSRYLDNLYTTEDAHKLLDELADPTCNEVLEELASNAWDESSSQQLFTDLEREEYKREAHQLLKHIEHKKRTWIRRIALVSVGIAAMLCLVWGGFSYLNYKNEQQIVYMEASTSYGECKQFLLPDGTQLVLNACSRVRYPNSFIGEERKIELEGEGFFRVHRNEKQPFIIKTSRFKIHVLGTSFNVKSYASDEIVSVEVESGKVQVDLPEAMMRLQAKEQIRINTVSNEYNKCREERPVAVWQKGGLRFNSTPIRDVAKELERMYNRQIIFAKGQEFKNLISGEHDNKSLEAVLQSMEYTSGIRYKKEGDFILLYKK